MVFNSPVGPSSLSSLVSGPPRLPPEAAGRRADGARHAFFAPRQGRRRCPAPLGINPWRLQVVDMSVFLGKHAVVGAGASSPANVFTAVGSRLMTKVLLI